MGKNLGFLGTHSTGSLESFWLLNAVLLWFVYAGDSQRLGGNSLGRPTTMASSSHHQPGVHSPQQIGLPNGGHGGVMLQQGMHRIQEGGIVQYQSGQMSQSNNMAPQQPGHCSSSNGAAAHQSVQGCSSGFQQVGFSPLHGDFHVKSPIVPHC